MKPATLEVFCTIAKVLPIASGSEIWKQCGQMNLKCFCGKWLLLALVVIGQTGRGLAQADTTAAGTNNAPVFPQDLPTIDIYHDQTAYQSAFDMDTNRTLPMLFIVGDSTVHNYSGGRVGWGDIIAKYFDTNRIRIENHALAGRSSRTFITEGWWDKILAAAKPGDYVIIQMGHNDASPVDDATRSRGTLHGIGEEQKVIFNRITQTNETVHTYGWYLREYISDARAHGMTTIICSPVPHLPKAEVKPGEIEKSDYVGYAGEIATNANVTFINLNKIVMGHFAAIAPAELKDKYYVHGDNIHFIAAGAEVNVQSVIKGLRATDSSLKQYLIGYTSDPVK